MTQNKFIIALQIASIALFVIITVNYLAQYESRYGDRDDCIMNEITAYCGRGDEQCVQYYAETAWNKCTPFQQK